LDEAQHGLAPPARPRPYLKLPPLRCAS
jgi:hypothetical protein